MGERVEIPVSF